MGELNLLIGETGFPELLLCAKPPFLCMDEAVVCSNEPDFDKGEKDEADCGKEETVLWVGELFCGTCNGCCTGLRGDTSGWFCEALCGAVGME